MPPAGTRAPEPAAGSADPLVATIRAVLAAAADPERAPAMQAYMKSAMPFLGIGAAARRSLVRPLVRAAALERPEWERVVAGLWDSARFREERYAALDVLALPRARRWHDPALLPLLRRLVVEGAWWDYVDDLAIHHVGPVLQRDRLAVTAELRRWAVDPDRWLRRTAVLAQVGLGTDVDLDLLAEVIDANVSDSDFFLRKGIGWALRQQARTTPDWVVAFVAARPQLSVLSRREALRHL